jgi:hypothetical protein
MSGSATKALSTLFVAFRAIGCNRAVGLLPRRGLASPGESDALSPTFAYPVARRDGSEQSGYEQGLDRLKRRVV